MTRSLGVLSSMGEKRTRAPDTLRTQQRPAVHTPACPDYVLLHCSASKYTKQLYQRAVWLRSSQQFET